MKKLIFLILVLLASCKIEYKTVIRNICDSTQYKKDYNTCISVIDNYDKLPKPSQQYFIKDCSNTAKKKSSKQYKYQQKYRNGKLVEERLIQVFVTIE